MHNHDDIKAVLIVSNADEDQVKALTATVDEFQNNRGDPGIEIESGNTFTYALFFTHPTHELVGEFKDVFRSHGGLIDHATYLEYEGD